jgi:DNA-binding NarL/FixJ family response regulator
MAKGTTATKAIAKQLNVSNDTAKSHVQRIIQKFGVPSRGAAIAKAFNEGLISDEPDRAGRH